MRGRRPNTRARPELEVTRAQGSTARERTRMSPRSRAPKPEEFPRETKDKQVPRRGCPEQPEGHPELRGLRPRPLETRTTSGTVTPRRTLRKVTAGTRKQQPAGREETRSGYGEGDEDHSEAEGQGCAETVLTVGPSLTCRIRSPVPFLGLIPTPIGPILPVLGTSPPFFGTIWLPRLQRGHTNT